VVAGVLPLLTALTHLVLEFNDIGDEARAALKSASVAKTGLNIVF
jgi:hypothetical protein